MLEQTKDKARRLGRIMNVMCLGMSTSQKMKNEDILLRQRRVIYIKISISKSIEIEIEIDIKHGKFYDGMNDPYWIMPAIGINLPLS